MSRGCVSVEGGERFLQSLCSLTGLDLTGSRIMTKNGPHFRWVEFDGSRSS